MSYNEKFGRRDRHAQREDDVKTRGEQHVKAEDWRDTPTSPRMPKMAGKASDPRKAQGFQSLRWSSVLPNLDSELLAFRNEET